MNVIILDNFHAHIICFTIVVAETKITPFGKVIGMFPCLIEILQNVGSGTSTQYIAVHCTDCVLYEPLHEKTNDLHMRKQRRVTAQLISALVFATRIVLFLFYLYPNFQASSCMLSVYSLVCVGPGQKPKLMVLSCTGSYVILLFQLQKLRLPPLVKQWHVSPCHRDMARCWPWVINIISCLMWC